MTDQTPENRRGPKCGTAAAAARAAKRRRTRIGTAVGAVLVLGAIAAGTLYGIRSDEKVDRQDAPETTSEDYAFAVGNPNSDLVLDIYEDFQCPACGMFEASYGKTLADLAEGNHLQIRYHMMAFLGPESMRATAAAGCAADAGKFAEFHTYAYAHQPAEHTGGYTTDQLLRVGDKLDLGEDYAQCVTDGTYSELGAKINEEAAKGGVSGTPTTFVNGRKVDPAALFDVLSDALNGPLES